MLQRNLKSWAFLGVLVFMALPWFMPSNKLYHQLMIAFLWLPAFLVFFLSPREVRAEALRFEFVALILFSMWTILVVLKSGGDLGKLKIIAYVWLTIYGLLFVGGAGFSFERVVYWATVLGGAGVLLSLVKFYVVDGFSFVDRLGAVGVWDTAIMAAHAVGALLVLGVALRGKCLEQSSLGWKCAYYASLAALVLFIFLNQTRGVWVALLAAMCLLVLLERFRVGFLICLAMGLGFVSFLFFKPEFLTLGRGMSYRPQIWSGGLELMKAAGFWGLGFGGFLIPVPELGVSFKHPHNLFMNICIQLGWGGGLLFGVVWGGVLLRSLQFISSGLGRAVLVLWIFSTVSLMTDGIGIWLKPNADWMVTWLPVALAWILVLRHGRRHEKN